jgi:Phytanoyl-CoA dioxygenase (PhyH)
MHASRQLTQPVLRTLRAVLMTPLWLLQLLHVSKSFEQNPIIGSRLLNRLGLHVLRVVLAHGITRLRWIVLAPLLPGPQRRMFREQGYLVLTDFLPAKQFAVLNDEVRNYRGEVRECIQGDTQTHRTLLHDRALHDLPACRFLLHDRRYRRVLQWTAVRYGQPLIFIEQVRNGFVSDGGADPQKDLHADTFHPTMKAWLYLDDVTAANGPFAYVSGSSRLTWRRLCWEYRQSVQGRELPDRYSRRGSLRLTEQDRQALGLSEPCRFAVPANTLVVANTFGFHARSPADRGSTRLAIYADSRTNPFNPWPGLDLHWSSQLKYRALQWYRRRQDQQAARCGVQSSWHRVDPDAPGPDGTAA